MSDSPHDPSLTPRATHATPPSTPVDVPTVLRIPDYQQSAVTGTDASNDASVASKPADTVTEPAETPVATAEMVESDNVTLGTVEPGESETVETAQATKRPSTKSQLVAAGAIAAVVALIMFAFSGGKKQDDDGPRSTLAQAEASDSGGSATSEAAEKLANVTNDFSERGSDLASQVASALSDAKDQETVDSSFDSAHQNGSMALSEPLNHPDAPISPPTMPLDDVNFPQQPSVPDDVVTAERASADGQSTQDVPYIASDETPQLPAIAPYTADAYVEDPSIDYVASGYRGASAESQGIDDRSGAVAGDSNQGESTPQFGPVLTSPDADAGYTDTPYSGPGTPADRSAPPQAGRAARPAGSLVRNPRDVGGRAQPNAYPATDPATFWYPPNRLSERIPQKIDQSIRTGNRPQSNNRW